MELRGAKKRQFKPAVLRVADWAIRSKDRLRFIVRLISVSRNKSQYRVVLRHLAEEYSVATGLSEIQCSIDVLFDSKDIGNNRGDLFECIVGKLSRNDMGNCITRYECKVAWQDEYLSDAIHNMDIGHLDSRSQRVMLLESKANLDNFLTYQPEAKPPIGPDGARRKVCYMKRLLDEITLIGWEARVAFVTLNSQVPRAVEKVHAISEEIAVWGLDTLESWLPA